jgi:pilus assembly protein CpaB
MLRRETLIALVIALVLGLVAVFLANSYISSNEQRQMAQGTTKVAVAAVPLAFGTDITPDKVRFVDFPNSSIPAGSFRSVAQLRPAGKQRFALMTISLNEQILASKISAEGQGASIAALLPAGKRAPTVRVNAVSGVAGFIQPNDQVDVLITRNVGGSDVTDVLLQNIRVIAIDQRSKNPDGGAKVGRTATLEVTPIDAQKLALGESAGNLSLVLRKPGDTNDPVVETVSLSDLRYNMYGGARYPAPAVVGGLGGAIGGAMERSAAAISAPRPRRTVRRTASAKPAPAPEPRSVEIVRGLKGNDYNVGEHGS